MAKLSIFSELKKLPLESRWFEAYSVPDGVTAIYEPHHFQEVISYLIEGKDSTLLFDAGMGIGNIKAVVESLTDKPVTLVNSHSHFDHVGGSWQFGETHLLNVDECVEKVRHGFSLPADDANRSEEALTFDGDRWFDLSSFCVRPCEVRPIEEGHVFNLGERELRVIATPGHSADSIMLADDRNRILFTGDTVYPGPLYAFIDGPDCVPVYADTMKKLAESYCGYTLCCSHNNPVWEGSALHEISCGFQRILAGECSGVTDSSGHAEYSFCGFSIIV